MAKLLFFTLFFICYQASAKPLILFVHSYNMDNYKWTASIQEGVLQRLSKEGLVINKDYRIQIEMLDVHKYKDIEQRKMRGDLIRKKLKKIKPDYIVTTDDDALQYVGIHVKKTPVVFNGINKDISFYFGNGTIELQEKPGHNITGVYQTIYFKQSIELAKKVKPEIKTFAFIADKANTSLSLYQYLQKVLPTIELKYVDSHISNSVEKWKEVLKAWEGKVDVILTGTPVEIAEKSGRQYSAPEAFKFLKDNTSALVLGNWVFQVEFGALLSMADSGHQQGWYTGEYLIQIMNGKKPGDLPIVTPKEGVPSVNLSELKKKNLKLDRTLRWEMFQKGVVISDEN